MSRLFKFGDEYGLFDLSTGLFDRSMFCMYELFVLSKIGDPYGLFERSKLCRYGLFDLSLRFGEPYGLLDRSSSGEFRMFCWKIVPEL